MPKTTTTVVKRPVGPPQRHREGREELTKIILSLESRLSTVEGELNLLAMRRKIDDLASRVSALEDAN